MKTNYQLQNIAAASQDQAFVDESARIAVPYTAIVGRAQIPDLANDFRASLGIERIPVQQIIQLQNEFGPSGEPVYAALNDTRGLIRYVGSWNVAVGGVVYSSLAGSFIEITFQGTGLNILLNVDGTARVWNYSVDGGSPVTGAYPSSGSGILSTRTYAPNQPITVTDGLPLGVHTIKIICVNNYIDTLGFEILNANASGLVNVNPGTAYYRGNKIKNTAADSIAYNAGVTGTKGGRVVRYFTGTDAPTQAVTVVDTTAFYLTNANHANEEVARTYNWREFGAGRYSPADDFSLYASGSSVRAFTLEDGTTTLVGTVGGVVSESVYTDISQFVTLTFVGTGVDVDLGAGAGGAKTDTVQAWIDGSNVGNMPTTNNTNVTIKVASGLAYGTHTHKLLRTVNSIGIISYKGFKVYQPKKPTLPVGAIEIADYNVMANYAYNTTAGLDTIATGTLRKAPIREVVYVGSGWAPGIADPNTKVCGWDIYSNTNGDYCEYTFFGTGFECRTRNGYSNSILVSLQNLSSGGSLQSLTSGHFAGLTTGAYGGSAFDYASSGVLNISSGGYGCGMYVSGLTLGLYKVRFANQTSNYIILDALDIITPIHSHKSNLYADLQNTLPVGSQSLMDSRSVSPQPSSLSAPKAWAQAVGVTSGPTTSATSPVPIPDLSCTLKTTGNPIRISLTAQVSANQATNIYLSLFVDGVMVTQGSPGFQSDYSSSQAAVGCNLASINMIHPVSAGVHSVVAMWCVGGGGASLGSPSTKRMLTVEEK